MVRKRIPSTSSNEPRTQEKDPRGNKKSKKTSNVPSFYLKLILVMFVVAVLGYYTYQGYLETRVHTPLNLPRAVDKNGLQVPRLYWGSYRPGVYFGLKTRSPADLLFGMMWMIPDKIKNNDIGLRHWCEQGDNLDSFGWTQHDGETFGIQEIKERGLVITTSFLKDLDHGLEKGGQWSARISVKPSASSRIKSKSISLFLYAGMDDNSSGFKLAPMMIGDKMSGIMGKTNSLGDFRMNFVTKNGVKREFYSLIESLGPHKFTENVMHRLRRFGQGNDAIGLDSDHMSAQNPNLIVYQVNADLPFEMDIEFENNDQEAPPPFGELYTAALSQKQAYFNKKFEETFGLEEKYGDQSQKIKFAQAAMSNMIGGIGYFYGHSLVQSVYQTSPVKYWDGPLFTGVPSRSFFPRGFLWDEGFHNLLISKWNKRLSADIIAHWLDMMNIEGWIPREQILGLEARAKVPDEFVVQKNTNANPPTLLLTLHSMVHDFKQKDDQKWFKEYLKRIWPRLEVWYNWFNQTQNGLHDGTFRWRGRNGSAIYELNPKTLTSGLDDFPRASHPTEEERHVDLRCWMALASKLMADIGDIIGMQDSSRKYKDTSSILQNNKLLDDWHWSEIHGAYLDYGLHSEDVVLQRPKSQNRHQNIPQQKQRVVHEEPKYQYVNQVGYISLFPFLVQIVDPNSPKLGKILRDISNPDIFWTPYGLRSLSKSASIYMKKNTEHDAPYWRGPIWININYLAVRALYNYAQLQGPYQKIAQDTYQRLRQVLVENIFKQFVKTGYIWEQYNDKNGQGQGCRPFTGWSALVVLMMGEKY